MIDGKLSLTTPEGIRLLLTPAGPASRAWAWAIDFLIWIVTISILRMVLSGSKPGMGIYSALLFVTYWGYPIICEVYFGGRTIGKRTLGIQVLRDDGLPVGWRESALRNLLLVADFLPMMYATGLLCMLFTAHFRRLGDIVAGTQVVYREKPSQRAAVMEADSTPALFPQAPELDDRLGARILYREKPSRRAAVREVDPIPTPFPLTPEQQRALIDLFEREKRLPHERLHELGTIAEPLTGETGEASVERLRGFAAGLMR